MSKTPLQILILQLVNIKSMNELLFGPLALDLLPNYFFASRVRCQRSFCSFDSWAAVVNCLAASGYADPGCRHPSCYSRVCPCFYPPKAKFLPLLTARQICLKPLFPSATCYLS